MTHFKGSRVYSKKYLIQINHIRFSCLHAALFSEGLTLFKSVMPLEPELGSDLTKVTMGNYGWALLLCGEFEIAAEYIALRLEDEDWSGSYREHWWGLAELLCKAKNSNDLKNAEVVIERLAACEDADEARISDAIRRVERVREILTKDHQT